MAKKFAPIELADFRRQSTSACLLTKLYTSNVVGSLYHVLANRSIRRYIAVMVTGEIFDFVRFSAPVHVSLRYGETI